MTISKLVSLVAKREGKKSQVSVGDIREIIAIVSEVLAEEEAGIGRVQTYSALVVNGKRRLAKKTKK